MGNRSFLVLGTAQQINDGDGRPFADANNNFPTLWQLLLAEGEAATANTFQRVFGDSGTPNLAGNAMAAMARVQNLADGIRDHPLYDTQPPLEQYFAALQSYFAQEVTAIHADTDGELFFSANLDELGWLTDVAPDQFIEQMRAQCAACAADVDAALNSRSFPALDRALELTEHGQSFSDWTAWNWSFGFGGLDHAYFSEQDTPRDIAFDAFREESEAEHDNHSWLGDNIKRFTENGKTGIRRTSSVDDGSARGAVLIAAEWDAIESTGHSKSPLFWVHSGDRIGLVRADSTGAELLHSCEFSEVWNYEKIAQGWLAAVRVDAHIGILRDNGEWCTAPDAYTPRITEIEAFIGDLAIAHAENTVGVVDTRGTWTTQPTFEQIDELRTTGIAIAQQNNKRCLIDARSGAVRTDEYDQMYWLNAPGAFASNTDLDGGAGWWRDDASPMIAPTWDSITLLSENPLRIASVRNALCGLLDGDGQELIPAAYSSLAPFTAMSHDRSGSPVARSTLIRVSKGEYPEERSGAWDLTSQREIIACEYKHLYPIPLYHDNNHTVHGFLAVRYAPGHSDDNELPLRVGILTENGIVLHDLVHAWIAVRRDSTSLIDAMQQARAIFDTWSRNEPVQAALSSEDRYVWLTRDGRVADDMTTREAKYRAGDFAAAYSIAQAFRDGDGVEQNSALAERWMLLAAGQPESVFDAPEPSFFKRVLGGKRSSSRMPDDPDPRGSVDAVCALAQSLIENPDDAEGLAAARAWLELVNEDGGRASSDAEMLLGYMLLEGVGGRRDEPRAFTLTQRATRRGNTAASFNLGLMHEFGRGTVVNAAEARTHFGVASRAGDVAADLGLARLLLDEVATNRNADSQQLKQAAYHLQTAVDGGNDVTISAASALLGKLYWSGRGVSRDTAHALTLLESAAQFGDQVAIHFLADEVYGSPASSEYSPEHAEAWAQQLRN